MRKLIKSSYCNCWWLMAGFYSINAKAQSSKDIPHLHKKGTATQPNSFLAVVSWAHMEPEEGIAKAFRCSIASLI